MDLGASAVTMTDAEDQPLFEPPVGATPLWDNTIVTGLFPAETDAKALIEQIKPRLGDTPLPEWKAEILEDQDWTRVWMDSFRPMRFGKRVWICPSTYAHHPNPRPSTSCSTPVWPLAPAPTPPRPCA